MASCACCSVIPVPIAPLVGFVAAILTLGFEELLVCCQIDDAVGAAAWDEAIRRSVRGFREFGEWPMSMRMIQRSPGCSSWAEWCMGHAGSRSLCGQTLWRYT